MMFPKLKNYTHMAILSFLDIDTSNYSEEFEQILKKKKTFYYFSLIFSLPIVLVLSFFAIHQFQTAWWSFFMYLMVTSIISFLFISLPTYQAMIKPLIVEENRVCQNIDDHLSTLAKQQFFSKHSKVVRLLNQEFELVSLTYVTPKDLTMINQNQTLTTFDFCIVDKDNNQAIGDKKGFYENQSLNPIVLAKINMYNKRTRQFTYQAIVPLEFTLVRGLVSEQLTYLEKDDYLVNPHVNIDGDHFKQIYTSNRTEFLNR